MAGKQQGWDVNPGLTGTNGHTSSPAGGCTCHPAGWALSVGMLCGPQPTSCLEPASLRSSCHTLPCNNCQIYITSVLFPYTLDMFTMTTPISPGKKKPAFLTRPWSLLKKKTCPAILGTVLISTLSAPYLLKFVSGTTGMFSIWNVRNETKDQPKVHQTSKTLLKSSKYPDADHL